MPTDQSQNVEEQEPQVTSVGEWGKAKQSSVLDPGMVVELPSGNVCRIKRTMDMMTLLQAGKIPNPLAGVVSKMISSGGKDFAAVAAEEEDPEVTRQLFDLINQTMSRSFIEPPVSAPPVRGEKEDWDGYLARIAEPVQEEGETTAKFNKRKKEHWHKPGTLSVNDIEMQDKMFVFAVAQGAAADLVRFREESDAALGTVQAREPVVKPTKRTGGGRSKK